VLASVRRRGVRAVCAYARGDAHVVDDFEPPTSENKLTNVQCAQRLYFNPFINDTFTLADGRPVYRAAVLLMDSPLSDLR
jgi:hypothetical protein